MFTKRLTIKSVLFNLFLVMPIFSYAAISEQDKSNFNAIYGSEIKPEIAANIIDFCDKNDTDVDSCLSKLKAQPTQEKSIQSNTNYRLCCLNVSNFLGEYAHIHGEDYCIPPC